MAHQDRQHLQPGQQVHVDQVEVDQPVGPAEQVPPPPQRVRQAEHEALRLVDQELEVVGHGVAEHDRGQRRGEGDGRPPHLHARHPRRPPDAHGVEEADHGDRAEEADQVGEGPAPSRRTAQEVAGQPALAEPVVGRAPEHHEQGDGGAGHHRHPGQAAHRRPEADTALGPAEQGAHGPDPGEQGGERLVVGHPVGPPQHGGHDAHRQVDGEQIAEVTGLGPRRMAQLVEQENEQPERRRPLPEPRRRLPGRTAGPPARTARRAPGPAWTGP